MLTTSESGGHSAPVAVATLVSHVFTARRPNTHCQLILWIFLFFSRLGLCATSLSPTNLWHLCGRCACTRVTLLSPSTTSTPLRLVRICCLSFTHDRHYLSDVLNYEATAQKKKIHSMSTESTMMSGVKLERVSSVYPPSVSLQQQTGRQTGWL